MNSEQQPIPAASTSTAMTPAFEYVPPGNKARQQMAAVSTLSMNFDASQVANIVKIDIRKSIDKAIRATVANITAAKAAVGDAEKAINEVALPVPPAFKKDLDKMVKAMQPFFADVRVASEPHADTLNVAMPERYSVHAQTALPPLTIRRTYPIPASTKPLFAAHAEAAAALRQAETELQRLHNERSRLNELSEEAAAALTMAQLDTVDGGDTYRDALKTVAENIRKRLGLPVVD